MDVAQLKRRRLAAAIPGNLLCGRAGISRTRLSDIERGYVAPSPGELQRLELLPQEDVTQHPGWQRAGSEFMFGREHISPEPEEEEVEPEVPRPARIVLVTETPGEAELAAGFRSQGSLDEYLRSVSTIAQFPLLLVLFYASFTAPLLRFMGVPNFLVDLSGPTGSGKTSGLYAAAAAWGQPDQRKPDAIVKTWDATKVALERYGAMCGDLALYLDDTKCAQDPTSVAAAMYLIAAGRGRSRGTTFSIDRTPSFHTIGLSTGEAPCTTFTRDGGIRGRALTLRGLALGARNAKQAKLARQLKAGAVENFGLAGPAFIRELLSMPVLLERLAGRANSMAEKYAAMSDAPEADRLAQYMGSIGATAALVDPIFGPRWDWREALEQAWLQAIGEAEDAPQFEQALLDVYGWANSQEHTFRGREDVDRHGVARRSFLGMSGVWPIEDWEYLGFYPPVLRRVLKEMGYTPAEVLFGWRENGWIDVRSDGRKRFTKQVRSGRQNRCDVVAIRRDAIERLLGGDGGDTSGDGSTSEESKS